MRLAVGSILESVGFTHAAASALELITDIGVRYMRKLATTAARSAEMGTVGRRLIGNWLLEWMWKMIIGSYLNVALSRKGEGIWFNSEIWSLKSSESTTHFIFSDGRTRTTDADVIASFGTMRVNVDEMNEYMRQVRPSGAERVVSFYFIMKENILKNSHTREIAVASVWYDALLFHQYSNVTSCNYNKNIITLTSNVLNYSLSDLWSFQIPSFPIPIAPTPIVFTPVPPSLVVPPPDIVFPGMPFRSN